jgi:hypothetical protein
MDWSAGSVAAREPGWRARLFFQAGTAARLTRRRDATELLVGWALIMGVIWAPERVQRWTFLVPLLWVLGVGWLRFESWSAMGLRSRNLLRSSWLVGIALVLAAAAAGVAARFGTLQLPADSGDFTAYGGYAAWSFLQEFLLLSFFLARLRRLFPGRYWAASAAAGLFAVAHLPNPVLTPMTLVWGMVSCLTFLRYRNVWTLGLAHAILGITVALALPAASHEMQVGTGYLRYQPRVALAQRN